MYCKSMTTKHDDPNELLDWYDVPEMKQALSAGEVLRAFRQCDNLTLKAVAAKAGISYQLLWAYERGEKLPSLTLSRFSTRRQAPLQAIPPLAPREGSELAGLSRRLGRNTWYLGGNPKPYSNTFL